jgi:hemoglobin-like flavoprotein
LVSKRRVLSSKENPMTPEQVTVVKESWKKVVPIADQAAALFYGRLFELDPALEPMFKTDLKSQGRKLTSMIHTAVVNLHQLASIVPAVQDLGRRHVGYGVRESDYDTVAAALLWTLEQGLGDDFDAPAEAAWAEAYTTLANVMKSAAIEYVADETANA